MKTVYIVTYQYLGETKPLIVFPNRADAEEYCMAIYMEVSHATFNRMLMDMTPDKAIKNLKYYINPSSYNIEECVYQD